MINLSSDKLRVYKEAYRILKSGGRIAIADVVSTGEIPDSLKTATALACWVSGAVAPSEIEKILQSSGFVDVVIKLKPESKKLISTWMPGSGAENYVISADIQARKPTEKERMVSFLNNYSKELQAQEKQKEATKRGHGHGQTKSPPKETNDSCNSDKCW